MRSNATPGSAAPTRCASPPAAGWETAPRCQPRSWPPCGCPESLACETPLPRATRDLGTSLVTHRLSELLGRATLAAASSPRILWMSSPISLNSCRSGRMGGTSPSSSSMDTSDAVFASRGLETAGAGPASGGGGRRSGDRAPGVSCSCPTRCVVAVQYQGQGLSWYMQLQIGGQQGQECLVKSFTLAMSSASSIALRTRAARSSPSSTRAGAAGALAGVGAPERLLTLCKAGATNVVTEGTSLRAARRRAGRSEACGRQAMRLVERSRAQPSRERMSLPTHASMPRSRER